MGAGASSRPQLRFFAVQVVTYCVAAVLTGGGLRVAGNDSSHATVAILPRLYASRSEPLKLKEHQLVVGKTDTKPL